MIRNARRQILALIIFVLALTAVLENAAQAVEPYVEFVEGLRARKFYDYTLLYLDTLKDDPSVPDEIRQVVPYEKAQTLLLMARGGVTNPEVQGRQLEQALGYLKEFREKNPDHSKAGEAATEEARILLGQARVEVWQSRSPGNKENRAEFQLKARNLVIEARKIFQAAHDKHKSAWETFPKFIDKIEEPQRFAARSTAETRYILAQLDLANCTYEEGQTWDQDSTEYAAKLRDAAQEYEDIHSKYRSMLGGLYARTWQGKCFEEQDDIDRAVGIYKELLGHPGTSAAMQRLQGQVLQFYLICLNHDKKKDYQLVVDRATAWMKQARGRQKFSAIALGIKWEHILALESLSADRTTDENDRKRNLASALGMVRDVKRFPGRYKDLAVFKERDLMVLLRGEGALEDPEDFNTAFGLAQELVTKKTKEIDNKRKEASGSKDADAKRKAAEDWQNHLDRTTHLLKLCLRLADDKTAVSDLNLTRYYLAYMHLLSRRNYEAAILAEFIAINYGKDNPVQAQDSAYMALGGYVQAFNDNGKARRKEDQKIDVARMTAMANLLTERWPSSDRATDARLQLGSVYAELKEHEKAAISYSQVPETAAKYTDSQTRAGQAYWAAYIDAANLPPETQPTQAKLAEWMAKAEQHLITGIEREEANTPPATAATGSLIFAKVSRVQIIVARGDYPDAVKLLTGEPHPVMGAIQVADEAERTKPKAGIKSIPFASLAYQLLLRSYVGTGQLDEARDAMKGLEAVGGGDGEQITEMYKQLGKELQNELERLKGLNQTQQLTTVRKSFESFLGEMFKRPDQTAGSLTWIAETYYGLAQGSNDDPAQSAVYFERAADTYQKILDKSAEDASFIEDARRLMGVRLRLANCRRFQGDHELAMTLLKKILGSEKGENYLDAQIEAASTLQSWGESDPEKYVRARSGLKIGKEDRAKIWGWAKLAGMMQRKMQMSPADKEKFQTKLYDARYNLSLCKQLHGEAQPTPAKKKEVLSAARAEIYAFAQITPDIPDEYWDKFDELYGKILSGLGEPVVALERPKQIQPMTQADRKKKKADEKKAKKKKATAEVSKKPEENSSTTLIVFGVVALLGLGGGGFLVMKGSKGGRRTPAYAASPSDDLVIAPPPAAPARKKRPAGARPQPGAPATGQTAAPQQKQARRRPLTPEEREKRARMKAAKAKAEQQKKKKPDQPPQ
jgi:cellulose synthase operon protein C